VEVDTSTWATHKSMSFILEKIRQTLSLSSKSLKDWALFFQSSLLESHLLELLICDFYPGVLPWQLERESESASPPHTEMLQKTRCSSVRKSFSSLVPSFLIAVLWRLAHEWRRFAIWAALIINKFISYQHKRLQRDCKSRRCLRDVRRSPSEEFRVTLSRSSHTTAHRTAPPKKELIGWMLANEIWFFFGATHRAFHVVQNRDKTNFLNHLIASLD
jgi:hypothetical protein